MLDELAPLLTTAKANDLVARLELRRTDQAIATEFELAMAWAASRLFPTEFEPEMGGSRPDLLVRDVFLRPAVVEVTALSDSGFSGERDLGATSADVLTLLLWQFARPVLLANLIAWPVAYWLMHRWLSGFSYRIDLPFWPFAAATLATLLIALLTVGGQAWVAARQRSVLALRYESPLLTQSGHSHISILSDADIYLTPHARLAAGGAGVPDL